MNLLKDNIIYVMADKETVVLLKAWGFEDLVQHFQGKYYYINIWFLALLIEHAVILNSVIAGVIKTIILRICFTNAAIEKKMYAN